jgi:ArsR family transcriptional regulator, lead/cadmium/zinc/bismuth-responsive transcriptional repressor
MPRPRKLDQLKVASADDCEERVVHLPAVRAARAAQPGAPDLSRLADVMAIFADPTRLRIVAALDAAELCVCDLSATIGLTESAISHQLRSMRQLDIVRARKEGRRVFYSLDDEHIASIYRQAREHVLHRSIKGNNR